MLNHPTYERLTQLRLTGMARALAEQARLVVEGCEASGLLPHDLARVQRSFAAKFPLDP
mgnify:CR=1 FL=1